jgi:hypothetical protein
MFAGRGGFKRSWVKSEHLLQESSEVSTVQKLLAVAVLGASLAFTASAALADEGRYEPVPLNQPAQTEMVGQDGSSQSTLAGAPEQLPAVDTSRENGNNR